MSYLMTFNSTHDAIQAEEAVKAAGVQARIVGTPEALSADCGLSLKYSSDLRLEVEKALSTINFSSQSEIYAIIEQESGLRTYEKL